LCTDICRPQLFVCNSSGVCKRSEEPSEQIPKRGGLERGEFRNSTHYLHPYRRRQGCSNVRLTIGFFAVPRVASRRLAPIYHRSHPVILVCDAAAKFPRSYVPKPTVAPSFFHDAFPQTDSNRRLYVPEPAFDCRHMMEEWIFPGLRAKVSAGTRFIKNKSGRSTLLEGRPGPFVHPDCYQGLMILKKTKSPQSRPPN